MEFRTITDAEVDEAAAFAIEGMRVELYPLHVSVPKVKAAIEQCRKPGNFLMAAVEGGRIVAGIAAVVQEMPFFERCEAVVVMCRTVKPGAGEWLIRTFKRWADADMRVMRIQFPLEFDHDPRQQTLLSRIGFQHPLTSMVAYRE